MPEVMIMDEVTSALDPTITMQILRLISDSKKKQGTGIIFITHDLSVAVEVCDRIAVMQKGRIVETGKSNEIIVKPSHPYTKKLASALFEPVDKSSERTIGPPLINIKNLSVQFFPGSKNLFSRRSFYAVKNVSLDIRREEIFCLIGESGSGKTTLMNAILGLCPYQEGEIIFNNQPVKRPGDTVHQRLKNESQAVFQDPVASLDPYLSLNQSVMEPLQAKGVGEDERKEKIRTLMSEVGLPPSLLQKKPGRVSVGQNQRICIVRALSTEPNILFLDEPLSALDAVIRKETAEIIYRLKKSHGLTCFFITHDIRLAREIGTTVAVMYLGRIVEKAPVKDFFSSARHPYSQALLTNAFRFGPGGNKRVFIEGDISSPHDPPSGCVFHPRCPQRLPLCHDKLPLKKKITEDHVVFCHLHQSGL
jgi:peptide/nickel transport system ATP-binding protein